MKKEELKYRIEEAVRQSEFRESIRRVSLFGSYAYGIPEEQSDIDLLIEFRPDAEIGLLEYAGMHEYFSRRLRNRVDLVTPSALSKYIRKEVLQAAEPVYEVDDRV